jgi:hypothetical protein
VLLFARLDQALESVKVISGSDGQGQEFFECLDRCFKPHNDLAGSERNTRWEILELLIEDARWGLYQNGGLLGPGAVQFLQCLSQALTPAPLIVAGFTSRQPLQVPDQLLAIGDPIGADLVADQGSKQLLGAAAPDS